MASQYIKLPLTGSGGGGGAVDSFNGRTGTVVSQSGDYGASQIANTPAGNISAVNVQNAINELDSEKQPLDSDLTALAALATNGIIVRTGSGSVATRSIAATSSKITVTNADGVSSNPSVDVNESALNIQNMTGTLPVSRGGTGSTTASTARVALNIDQRTTFSNANYTVLSSDRYVAQVGTLTAPRTVTLPLASSVNAGQRLIISDESGSVSSTNFITVQKSGSDLINGASSAIIRTPFATVSLISDGSSKWTFDVTGVARGGTGLTTLPTNGQLAIGNGNGYTLNTLSSGTGILVTNAAGSITITNTFAASLINIDGGVANTNFGGILGIDGGNAT